MAASELCYLSASEASVRFKARTLSPVELVEALIASHDEVEAHLNATTILYHERALEQARKAEARYAKAGARLRRLEGVPVMIKDLHAIKGELNPQSCRIFARDVATDTLPTVERLLRAGAIPLARSTSSELGIPTVCTGALWGVTRNPWNLAMSPGGSSGGSGAALAAGMTPISDGSDFGGSLRIPASACGVFGYKPPFGRNPQDRGGVWGNQLGEFDAIEAEDDHTVRFDLAAPNAIFLKILPLTTYSILPMQELEAGTFNPAVDILGSGPFVVAEHLQDESWTVARNPHYHRDGHPLVDELIIRILPDDSARIAALRDGRVDIATFANPDTPLLLADVPGVAVVVQNTTNFFRLDVSAIEEDSPFTDLRVRQAAHYALDREAISQIVFGGEAIVDYPVPAGLGYEACRDDPFYVMPREERLAKARALLEEAGATGAKVGVIGSSTLMIYPLIAQVVQASLNEAGFDAFVEQIPAAEWYARVFAAETDFDLAVSWFAGYTDPAIVLFWWTEAGAAGWAHGYTITDERLDALIAKTRTLADGPERNAALAEVCSAINENSNVLALVNKPDYVAYRSDLIDAQIGRNESTFNNLKYAEEFSRID